MLCQAISLVLANPNNPNSLDAVQALGDCVDKLFNKELCQTNSDDISTLVNHLLRTVIRCVANRTSDFTEHKLISAGTIGRNNKSEYKSQCIVTNMISLFRFMTPGHFSAYIQSFQPDTEAGRHNLQDFVQEVLIMFMDLIKNRVYPQDWAEMAMLVNSVVLNSLRYLSHTIRDFFSVYFVHDVWNNFFFCAIAFLTQPSLQVTDLLF